jgi:hypothetical protein
MSEDRKSNKYVKPEVKSQDLYLPTMQACNWTKYTSQCYDIPKEPGCEFQLGAGCLGSISRT